MRSKKIVSGSERKSILSIIIVNMQKVRKCVIPAAGMGTRFLPATKAMPKEMFPIIDKPVMQMLVEEAV